MAGNEPPSPRLSQLPPIPASPTCSCASTANPLSQYNLPPPPPPRPPHAVLTKADLASSQAAYADLLSSAKAYRLALAALSTAASAFGAALESCARLKEARAELTIAGTGGAAAGVAAAAGNPPPLTLALGNSNNSNNSSNSSNGSNNNNNSSSNSNNGFGGAAPRGTCTADTLLAAAGLQHLVANHQHILSETVYRAFELPLLQDLDRWRAAVEDEEERYARAVEAQSREIRRLEKDGVQMMRRQRKRDVGQLRGHLVALTARLDGLTALHGDHAAVLLRESQEASARIGDASCSLVRAEVDIFESLARKGWSGGGLEDLLERGVDLFAADEDAAIGSLSGRAAVAVPACGGVVAGGGAKLFSILPPKSILADMSGADTATTTHGGGGGGGGGKTSRPDSLLGDADADRYQSLAEAVSAADFSPARPPRDRDADSNSVFSDFNRPRSVRPFSPQPQPLRLNPEDLLEDIRDDAAEPSSTSPSSASSDAAVADSGGHDGDGDDADDEAEVSPWRDEGLRRRASSDHGDGGVHRRVGSGLGDSHYLREDMWGDGR
ncbi:hypothetical protein VTH06DRAFT_8448 [Thermothelomyces fergusii]